MPSREEYQYSQLLNATETRLSSGLCGPPWLMSDFTLPLHKWQSHEHAEVESKIYGAVRKLFLPSYRLVTTSTAFVECYKMSDWFSVGSTLL